MSRAYWVKLSSMVSETIQEGDSAVHRVQLEDVLPEDEMTELLEACLGETEDWDKDEDGNYRTTLEDGTELVWNVKEGQIEASIQVTKEVSRKVEVQGASDEDYSDHKEKARANAQQNLQREESRVRQAIKDDADQIRKEATKKLSENEQERNETINEVLQRTYVEAIKRKARRLGNVTSEIEGTNAKGQYELTITVAE